MPAMQTKQVESPKPKKPVEPPALIRVRSGIRAGGNKVWADDWLAPI
jgi:hypothetical protein